MTKKILRIGSKMTIPTMKWRKKSAMRKEFDLKGHEGECVRAYIGKDGKYTIETRARQNVLICELDVPQRIFLQIDTGEVNEWGDPIYESQEKALDITKVELKEYVAIEEEVIKK